MLLQFIDQHFFSAMEVGELSGVNANDSHMNFAHAKNHFTYDIGIQVTVRARVFDANKISLD